MRFTLFILALLAALPAYPQAMRQAAERLLVAVPESARLKMIRPFDDGDRLDWHYTPRSRDLLRQHYALARGSSHRH